MSVEDKHRPAETKAAKTDKQNLSTIFETSVVNENDVTRVAEKRPFQDTDDDALRS